MGPLQQTVAGPGCRTGVLAKGRREWTDVRINNTPVQNLSTHNLILRDLRTARVRSTPPGELDCAEYRSWLIARFLVTSRRGDTRARHGQLLHHQQQLASSCTSPQWDHVHLNTRTSRPRYMGLRLLTHLSSSMATVEGVELISSSPRTPAIVGAPPHDMASSNLASSL